MKEFLIMAFANNAGLIVFLHVLGAVIWVGGMIALRFAVHPAIHLLEDPKVRLARVLQIMGGFFNIVLPFIVVLLLTAILMIVGLDFKNGDPSLYTLTHVKEGIWVVMAINFGLMYQRRRKAQQRFLSGDLEGAKALMVPIQRYQIPVNIFLGVLAIYFGVVLRGF